MRGLIVVFQANTAFLHRLSPLDVLRSTHRLCTHLLLCSCCSVFNVCLLCLHSIFCSLKKTKKGYFPEQTNCDNLIIIILT